MSIESSSDQDSAERKIGPTVTKDRWINHARNKLAKGYVLIVSTSRKNANFYSPVKGYEMCAYDVAKKLIADGTIIKTRAHHLGDVYELSGPLPQVAPAPKKRVIDPDDEPDFIEDIPDVDDADDEEDQLDDDSGDDDIVSEEEDDDFEDDDDDVDDDDERL
jgi:hypothetical protein